MSLTAFPNGIYANPIIGPGQGLGSIWGAQTYFVDTTNGNDNYPGTDRSLAKATIQAAVTLARDNDTIFIAPGVYTENVTTLDDLYSRNVTLVGGDGNMPGWDEGVRWVPSTTSSPCLNVKASGWRVLGINFWPGATSSGITFTSNMTSANFRLGTVAGSLCRGGLVQNCLFFGNATGKYGIIFQGTTGTNASHSINIINNKFTYIAAASGSAIYVAASGNPVYDCSFIGNMFESCTSGISTASQMGIVGSRFMYNSFGTGGTYASTGVLLDVTATATPAVTGGNHVYFNGFGCTKAAAAAGTLILLNGYDNAGGNACSDGIDTGLYKAS